MGGRGRAAFGARRSSRNIVGAGGDARGVVDFISEGLLCFLEDFGSFAGSDVERAGGGGVASEFLKLFGSGTWANGDTLMNIDGGESSFFVGSFEFFLKTTVETLFDAGSKLDVVCFFLLCGDDVGDMFDLLVEGDALADFVHVDCLDEVVSAFDVEEDVTTTDTDVGGELLLDVFDGDVLDVGASGDEFEELDGFCGEVTVVSCSEGDECETIVFLNKFLVASMFFSLGFLEDLLDCLTLVFVGVGVADGDVDDVGFAFDDAADVGASGADLVPVELGADVLASTVVGECSSVIEHCTAVTAELVEITRFVCVNGESSVTEHFAEDDAGVAVAGGRVGAAIVSAAHVVSVALDGSETSSDL